MLLPNKSLITSLFASILFIASAVVTFTGCSDSSPTLQEKIIKNSLLDSISDAVYYFPANKGEADTTVYLPLKRWDIIFTGAINANYEKPELTAIDALIPGYFNHLMIYIGKDSDDYAYAFEINVKNIELIDSKLVVDGGAELIAISKDYGEEPHSSGGHIIDKNYYLVRWAKTYIDETREKILDKDNELISQLQTNLSEKLPYQLEFIIPLFPRLLFDKKVQLVDDGLDNGAGCGDYLTTLLEDIAGVCMYNARINAAELVNYYSSDLNGMKAFIPPRLNPLGSGSIYVSELFKLGYYIKEDEPHIFSCDNSSEAGIVIPEKIYESDILKEIEY